MNPVLLRKAAALPARQLHLIGIGLLLIAAAALWFYALRAPLAALRTLRAEQAQLQVAGSDPALLAAQLAGLDADTRALARRLGNGPAQPAAQRQVALIGELGALAQAQGVTLHGVSPAPEETVMSFTRIAFEARVSGSYGALLAWMNAVEEAQANLSVLGFDMRAAETAGQIDLNIRIAAYQPQESTP